MVSLCLEKTFRIMRIAVFFLLIGILQSYANSAYSQKTRLSSAREYELLNILNEIEDNANFFSCTTTKAGRYGKKR
jgi:hypothetical protein